jgi:hypothetical protein
MSGGGCKLMARATLTHLSSKVTGRISFNGRRLSWQFGVFIRVATIWKTMNF